MCFSCLQFAVGSVFALMLWTVGLLKKPEFTKDTVRPDRTLVAVFMLAHSWDHAGNAVLLSMLQVSSKVLCQNVQHVAGKKHPSSCRCTHLGQSSHQRQFRPSSSVFHSYNQGKRLKYTVLAVSHRRIAIKWHVSACCLHASMYVDVPPIACTCLHMC